MTRPPPPADAVIGPSLTGGIGVRSGLIWSAVRNWGVRLGSVLVFFVLARILPKHELGLFAAANAIMAIADLLAENGLGDAVVQRRQVDDRLLSAATYFNVAAAVVVAAALILCAPLIERWMNAPGLAIVLVPVTAAVLFNAVGYVAQGVLRRDFRFKMLAARALTATAISGSVGIAMALYGFGVWSMVAQFLLMAAINAAMIWRAKPFRLVRASPLAARPLFGFSASVFANKALDYLSGRSVELAIVAGLGPVALALWFMASRLWAVMMQMISAVTMDVALPAFSRLAADRATLQRAFFSSAEVTAAIGVPCFILLSAISPEAMLVIFGRIDPVAGRILAMLSILGAFQLLQYYNGALLSAIGKPHVSLWIMIVRAVAMLACLALTLGRPLETVAQAFTLTQIAVTPISFFVGSRYVGYSLLRFAAMCLPFALGAAAMWGGVYLLRGVAPLSASPLLRMIELGAAGALVYLAFAAVFFRAAARRVLTFALRRTPRTAAI